MIKNKISLSHPNIPLVPMLSISKPPYVNLLYCIIRYGFWFHGKHPDVLRMKKLSPESRRQEKFFSVKSGVYDDSNTCKVA